MAGWKDKAPTFNEYVQQLPVETMAKVGMAKQKQYDDGVKSIQSNIDKVAGMDVIRGIDKTYLQSRINELGNSTRKFAAADFSDFQLVNSVNGMTGKIAKDENVINAVSSTMSYRKEVAAMEAAKKAGKSSPDNEYVFQKGANDWLSGGIEDSFNASYKEYFDVTKHVKDYFNATTKSGYTYDELYKTNSKGETLLTPTMQRLSEEGVFGERAQAIISQALSDARAQQQLQISGQYTYRNADENVLINDLARLKTSQVEDRQIQLDRLLLAKNSTKDVESLNKIQEKIDSLQSSIGDTNDFYFSKIQEINSNPDSVKSYLYSTNQRNTLLKMFSYKDKKDLILKNPEWEGIFRQNKEANDRAEFRIKQKFAENKHRDDKKLAYDKLLQTGLKDGTRDLKGNIIDPNKSNPNDPNSSIYSPDALVNTKVERIDKFEYQQESFNRAAQNYTEGSEKILFSELIEKNKDYFTSVQESKKTMTSEADLHKNYLTSKYNEEITKNGIETSFSDWKAIKMKDIQDRVNKNPNADPELKLSLKQFSDVEDLYDFEKINNELIEKEITSSFSETFDLSKLNTMNYTYQDINGESTEVELTPEILAALKLYSLKDKWDYGNKDKEKAYKANSILGQDLIISKLGEGFLNAYDKDRTTGSPAHGGIQPASIDKSNILEELNKLDIPDNLAETFESVENRIDNIYSINPDVRINLGNIKPDIKNTTQAEVGVNQLAFIKTFLTNYDEDSPTNYSSKEDYRKFKENLLATETLSDNFFINIENKGGGKQNYLLEHNSGGNITITENEARKLNLPIKNYFLPEDVKRKQEIIKYRGQYTKGRFDDIETYTSGKKFLLDEGDFPNLKVLGVNKPIIKINTKEKDGGFVTKMYIKFKNYNEETKTTEVQEYFDTPAVDINGIPIKFNNLLEIEQYFNQALTPERLLLMQHSLKAQKENNNIKQ